MEGSIAPTTPGQTKEAPKTATLTVTSVAAIKMEYYNRFLFVIRSDECEWKNEFCKATINMELYNAFKFNVRNGIHRCDEQCKEYLEHDIFE